MIFNYPNIDFIHGDSYGRSYEKNHEIWFDIARPVWEAGGRLNKKDGPTRYGDSHVKDKTS